MCQIAGRRDTITRHDRWVLFDFYNCVEPREMTITSHLRICAWALITVSLLKSVPAGAAERVLTDRLHHLRSGAVREWADFAEEAEGRTLRLTFESQANAGESTLRLRHRDVKQTWKLTINDREIGKLPPDENDMVTFWPLPAGVLKDGANTFVLSSVDSASDDVMAGDVHIDDRPRDRILSEAHVEVTVADAANSRSVPCRLTIVDAAGALMTVGAASRAGLAVRPGVIYTADGAAKFGLPAGQYRVYAGRGFEYGVDSVQLALKPGETAVRRLTLHREVPTDGWIACDTHCHTLTFSGHGDATLAERMVTLAGEGIELPIATDHNVHTDYEAAAQAAGVRRYFTPVIGNEVTTPRMGHFNIFPIVAGAKPVDQNVRDWPELFRQIRECPGVSAIVLNHPRDVHGGFRPFGPEHHLGPVGENLDGWNLAANALELVNSGALQSDPLLVYRDWFGLINHGFRLAPVAASDSHDVARYIVGQGRTYIRGDDGNPGAIDVAGACRNLAAGRTAVSLGLLCEMSVGSKSGPGDLVTADGEVEIAIRVLGPAWTTVSHVALYANGVKIREADVRESRSDQTDRGVKWTATWKLPALGHDVFLVAVATGPGVREPYWPIPRPYQPASPVWEPRVIGSTAPIWIDADKSGSFEPASEYARRLVDTSSGDFAKLLAGLANFDEAVVLQAARLVHVKKIITPDELLAAAAKTDAMPVRDGFRSYVEAWRESERARMGK
jgi:hypothetical protein